MTGPTEGGRTDIAPVVTARLVLDRLVAADAPALFDYRSRPDVSRYQGWSPARLEDAEAFVDTLANTPFGLPDTWFQFAVRLAGSRVLIGDVGIHFLEDEREVEIGFTLAPAHQGLGYATEAVRAVLDLLFGGTGTERVTAEIDPRNAPSIRLVERLGLRLAGHVRRPLWNDGEWSDDLRFAIVRSEWRERVAP